MIVILVSDSSGIFAKRLSSLVEVLPNAKECHISNNTGTLRTV